MSDADLTLTYSLKPEAGTIDGVKKVVKRLSNLDKSWDSMTVMERAASVLEELNTGWGDIAKRAAESSLKEAKKVKSIGMRSFNKGKKHRVVVADDSQLLLGPGGSYGAIVPTMKTIDLSKYKSKVNPPIKEQINTISHGLDFQGLFGGAANAIVSGLVEASKKPIYGVFKNRTYIYDTSNNRWKWNDETEWHDISTEGYWNNPKPKQTPKQSYKDYIPGWAVKDSERQEALIPLNSAVPMDIGYTPNWNRYEGLNNGALVRSAIGAILNYAYVPDWQSKFGIDETTAVGKFTGAQDADFKPLGYEYVRDKPTPNKKKKSLFTTAKDFLKDKMPDVLDNIKGSVISFAKSLPMMILKTIGRLIVSELLHITTLSFDITKKLFFMPAKTLVNGLHNILKSAASQSQIIQSIMQLTIIPFVLMFEYLLLPVVKAIIPIITNMVKIIASNKDSIMKWGDVLANFITKVVSPVLSMFDGKFFSNPISGVFNIMSGIMDGASQWFRSNSDAISRVFYESLISIGDFIASNGELAAEIVSSLADTISSYLRSDHFKGIYPSLKEAFITILDSVRQILTDPAVVQAMTDLLYEFVATVFQIIGDILRGGNSYHIQEETKQKLGISESEAAASKITGAPLSAYADKYMSDINHYNDSPDWWKWMLDNSPVNSQYGGFVNRVNEEYEKTINMYFNTTNYGTSSTDTFGKDGAISY